MCYTLNAWNQMQYDAMERKRLYDFPEEEESEFDEDEYADYVEEMVEEERMEECWA